MSVLFDGGHGGVLHM